MRCGSQQFLIKALISRYHNLCISYRFKQLLAITEPLAGCPAEQLQVTHFTERGDAFRAKICCG